MLKNLAKIFIIVSFFVLLAAFLPKTAYAQSTCPAVGVTPDFTAGGNVFDRLASQWNSYFGSKADVNNGILCNPTIYNATFSPSLDILSTSTQSGTSYTLATSDCNTIINFTALTRVLVTIPSNLPSGCIVTLVQTASGPVVPIPGNGASMSSPNGYMQTFSLGSAIQLEVTQNATGQSAYVVLSGDNVAGFGGSSAATNTMLYDASNALLPNTLNNLGLGTSNTPNFAGLILGNNTANNPNTIQINGIQGASAGIEYETGGTARWTLQKHNDSETGNNSGGSFLIGAYTDSGAYSGTMAVASRASGPFGTGLPYWSVMAPMHISGPIAVTPHGNIGNDVEFGATADAQPISTLGANPLTTVSGSYTVTVNWPNCCGTGGAISTTSDEYVNLQNATAVGGITPTGWLRVTSVVDNNDFTVNWTTKATSNATGGGTGVTVQPSFPTIADKHYEALTTGAGGFPLFHEDLFVANPSFLPFRSAPPFPNYQDHWSVFTTPNDTSGLYGWGATFHEIDLTNRGADQGYFPNIYGTPNPTIGLWFVPEAVYSWEPGGGTAHNWDEGIAFARSVTNNLFFYTPLSVQADSLTPAAIDPTGHGGVALDLMGSMDFLPANPFATTSGTSTITVTDTSGGLSNIINGNTVYIPSTYTIAGVTFGNGNYSIANVNQTNNTFQITGIGTASSTSIGGGANQSISFANYTPYAPIQFWGEFKHGITTQFFKADDGYLVNTQVGNGYSWNDYSNHTASINTDEPSSGNINIDLNPTGSGQILTHGNPIIPSVPNNAALTAVSYLSYPNGVWRMGVTTTGDAPPLFFMLQSTACAAADGYLQVTLTGGGCAVAQLSGYGLDVREAGAVCNDITNDAAAIQRAINFVEFETPGAVVRLPAGMLCLTNETITIGNGSATAGSTASPIVLFGILANNDMLPTTSVMTTRAGIDYQGTGEGIRVQGPLTGWGIQGISIVCHNYSGNIGIHVQSAQFADNRDISIAGCATGIFSDTVGALPPGYTNVNAMHNSWQHLYINLPNVATIKYGIFQTAGAKGNSCYNEFHDVWINWFGNTGYATYAIYLQATDSDTIDHVHTSYGGGDTTEFYAVGFDYTLNAGWPASTNITHLDPTSYGKFINIGTPNTSDWNFINDVVTTNGGSYPALQQLIPDHSVGQWVPTLYGKFDTLTPVYTTQSGTYTDNGWEVTAWFDIAVSSYTGTSSDTPLIEGLPFTDNTGQDGACTIHQYSGITLSGGYSSFGARVNPGSTIIVPTQSGNSSQTYGYLTESEYAQTFEITGVCTYTRAW